MTQVVTTRIDVDVMNKTSCLQFLFNNIPITTYTYTDDYITMSARSDKHYNTFTSYREGLIVVKNWMITIKGFDPDITKISPFKMIISTKKADNATEFQFIAGKKKIVRSTYSTDTNLITFWPRKEVSLLFSDFDNLYNFTVDIQKKIKMLEKYSMENDPNLVDSDIDEDNQEV